MRNLRLAFFAITTASAGLPSDLAFAASHTVVAQEQFTYRISGDQAVRPSQVRDDGAKTYLLWPADAELPAVFALDASGNEIMVDVWMRGGELVIDAIYPRLVFRLDRDVARADRRGVRR